MRKNGKVNLMTKLQKPNLGKGGLLFMSLNGGGNDSYSPDNSSRHVDFYDNMGVEKRTTLDNLYNDLLISQIIFTHVNDGLSEWRTIEDSELQSQDTRLKIKRVMLDAWVNFRKYGHVIILPILVDSENNKIPFNVPFNKSLEKKPTIGRVIVVSEFETSGDKITDVLSDDHGKNKSYSVNGKKIHPSRVIVLGGENTQSMLEGLTHYHNTYHDRSFETTRAVKESNLLTLATSFEQMQEAVLASVDDNTSPAMIMKKLIEAAETRARNLRSNANNENAYLIDKESESLINVAKQNITQMVEATKNALDIYTAVADYPRSRLLGESASSWGNVDTVNYVQTIHGKRMMEIEDGLVSLDNFVARIYNIKDTRFTWNPLAIEKAEINKSSNSMQVDNPTVSGAEK